MNRPRRNKGFTLIEILIVLLIIGIVTAVAAAIFSNADRGRRAEAVSQHLVRVIQVAQNRAIILPAVLGLVIDDNGFQFYQYWVDFEKNTGSWRKLNDDALSRPNYFPGQVRVQLIKVEKLSEEIPQSSSTDTNTDTDSDSETEENAMVKPKIIFLPNGTVTPFVLNVTDPGEKIVELSVQQNGQVILKIKTRE